MMESKGQLPSPLDRCIPLNDMYNQLSKEEGMHFRSFCAEYWLSMESVGSLVYYHPSWKPEFVRKVVETIQDFAMKVGAKELRMVPLDTRKYGGSDFVLQQAVTPTHTGMRFNTGKTPFHLLDPEALEGLAKVLEFGAKKYAAHNWRGGLPWMEQVGSLLRHLFAFMRGEDLDPETGLPHVDHLQCNTMFLAWMWRNRKDLDDRWKPTSESGGN